MGVIEKPGSMPNRSSSVGTAGAEKSFMACPAVTRENSARTYYADILRMMGLKMRESGAPDTIRTCDLCLRRATLYPAELRVRCGSFSRLAGHGQRPCEGLGWGRSKARKAKVTRSNRVGCARKARAERAGTVAGRIGSSKWAADGSLARRGVPGEQMNPSACNSNP
jgi:hypothetical protein